MKTERDWRTRPDAFQEVWPEIEGFLKTDPTVLATTLFDYLMRKYEGKFQEGNLRTLQRQIKIWKATEGAAQEVFFPQVHHPGQLCESDFTDMRRLGVTIAGQPFAHLLFHFALTYSNWESVTICFSESYEALSEGFQNAVWELGGVPQKHRTDCLSAAINNQCDREKFTTRYSGLMNYYHIEADHINAGCANENGDVEQSHHRFKLAVSQELILRGFKDFASRDQYLDFLQQIVRRRNTARQEKLKKEISILRQLPNRRLDDFTRESAKVSRNSTINVRHNIYSVDSRLIGERVEVRVNAETLQIWYGGKKVDEFERVRGESNHRINYRHIIDSLVRKPGAFANYRYQSDLFPRMIFRAAY
ncbi:IS21 family transposase, partial [bacterium]|nr:IS21 family transposase [bacterium]